MRLFFLFLILFLNINFHCVFSEKQSVNPIVENVIQDVSKATPKYFVGHTVDEISVQGFGGVTDTADFLNTERSYPLDFIVEGPGTKFETVGDLLSLPMPADCNVHIVKGDSSISISLKTRNGETFQLRADSKKLEEITLFDPENLAKSLGLSTTHGQETVWAKGDVIVFDEEGQVSGLEGKFGEKRELSDGELAEIQSAIDQKGEELYSHCSINSEGQAICRPRGGIMDYVHLAHKDIPTESVKIGNLKVINASALGVERVDLPEIGESLGVDSASEGEVYLTIADLGGEKKIVGFSAAVSSLSKGVATGTMGKVFHYRYQCDADSEIELANKAKFTEPLKGVK